MDGEFSCLKQEHEAHRYNELATFVSKDGLATTIQIRGVSLDFVAGGTYHVVFKRLLDDPKS